MDIVYSDLKISIEPPLEQKMQNDRKIYEAAEQHLNENRFGECIRLCDEILRDEPDNYFANYCSGYALVREQRYAQALPRLERAVLQVPEAVESAGALGYAFFKLGRYEEAAELLESLVKTEPGNARFRGMLAAALENSGHPTMAAKHYQNLMFIEPKNAEWPERTGICLAKSGNLNAALRLLEEAVEKHPGVFALHIELGRLRIRTGCFEIAEPDFEFCLADMKSNLTANDLGVALQQEKQISAAFIRTVESDDHAFYAFGRWSATMAEAGVRVGERLAPFDAPLRRPIKIGFVFPNGSLLAHTRIVAALVHDDRDPASQPYQPIIYVIGNSDEAFIQFWKELDVPVVSLGGRSADGNNIIKLDQIIAELRVRTTLDSIIAAVWITDPSTLAFASAYGIAPVQIFWAMRFHGLVSPNLDGYLTIGPLFEDRLEIHGQEWLSCPLIIQDLFRDIDPSQANQIRDKYSDFETILGTLARLEKIDSPEFLRGVGLALQANPNAGFLWSGQEESLRVVETFEEMGVGSQCKFVGWVDTRVYAQVLDIFLDTTPTGCGVAAMEAMAEAKPIVSFSESHSMWSDNVLPLLSSEVINPEALENVQSIFKTNSDRPLLICADTVEIYADRVSELIADEKFRVAVGAAGRAFCLKYLTNTTYGANILTHNLLKIIGAATSH